MKTTREKLLYEAPGVSLVEVRMDSALLTLSDGNGSQAKNVENIDDEDIVNGAW